MAKMIQIRNVSERLHRELVRRARARGLTLTEYLEQVLEREVARPPAEEVFARIAARTPVDISITGAELVRSARAEHESW